MAGNPGVWFEIYVQDMARAQAFYETVLAVKMTPMPAPDGEASGLDMVAFPADVDGGYGAAGTLVRMEGIPSGGNSTLVYFGCEDCAVEAGRVVAAGGSIFQDKFAIGPHGFCALVKDTEGNLVGLHSMK